MGRRAETVRFVAAFAAIYLIWGSTYLAIKFAIATIPPFLMLGFRFLPAAGLVVGSVVLITLRRRRPAAARHGVTGEVDVGTPAPPAPACRTDPGASPRPR